MYGNVASFVAIILLVIGLIPIVGGIGLGLWEAFIGPQFIPKAEVEQLADEMIAAYPKEPEQAALINEDRAWRTSDGIEQCKWRRVRREIRCRRDDPSKST